jgi:hypothetical protein
MPKEYSPADRKRWLELYESGKTDKWIAMNAGCDVRTVKRGIAQARLVKDARDAKADLIKEALRKHQADLLKLVGEIIPTLKLPPQDLMILPWNWKDDRVPIRLQGARCVLHRSEARASSVTLDAETRDEWGLLQEHLRNDPLWAALSRWKKTLVAHLLERAELNARAVAILQDKADLEVVKKRDVSPAVGIDLADFLLKSTQREAFGISEESSLGKDDGIDATTGVVTNDQNRWLGAGAIRSEEQMKKDLSDACRELAAASKGSPLAHTYQALAEATEGAAKAAKEISLLGLILGECRICRRLGG